MPTTRLHSGTGLAALALALAGAGAPPGPADEGEDLFRERILPLLEARCFECHGPAAPRLRGGLLLESRASLLRGGDSGPAVVDGDPEASLLVRAVRRTDPDLSMPPRGEALSAEDVATIERWVELGARWPAGLVAERAVPPPGDDAAAAAPADLPAPADPAALRHFENEIRPLLAESCFECHGPERKKVRGDLRMTGRGALLRGGLRGPALVPGRPDDSLLVKAVRWGDADLQMPPDRKLGERQIEALEQWVAMGAPWPDEAGAEGDAAGDDATAGPDMDAGRGWWAFRPVVRPPVPAVAGDAGVVHPIDAFVHEKLAAAGLEPAPPASRAELARRAYIDLLGLPPTHEEVQAFVADTAPDAWERLVDDLLARPQYGERWGRHWLDVVRWAQSDGYEHDQEKPEAWRYRDWVIGALNADLPYDRFLLEQLAGDELPDRDDGSLVATAFYRLGTWDSEPDDDEQAAFDELDDLVRTISEGFLGVTLGCARCHDHKFDPFGQEDYYSTLAFLRNVRRYAEARYVLDSPTLRPIGFDRRALEAWEQERQALVEARRAEHRGLIAEGRRRAVAAAGAPAAGAPRVEIQLRDALEHLDYDERQRYLELQPLIDARPGSVSHPGSLEWTLAVSESAPPVPDTHVLVRGRASAPAQAVPPRFVRVLCASDEAALPVLPEFDPRTRSSGRRRTLAEWIASPEHPTTARVLVNRVWQHHFGRGIVATPDDFGAMGSPPSHPELLDWLASEFVDRGWSLKALHRLILSSAAWQRSSRHADPLALERDPGNILLWRHDLRRGEAEVLRDAALAVSGTLDLALGGPAFFMPLSGEALAGSSRPGRDWEITPPEEADRRTVYAFVKRGLIPPLLEVFDYTNVSMPVGRRPVTTLASQALTLLNGQFLNRAADALAERVLEEAGPDRQAQVVRAFERALARRPAAEELALALAALDRGIAEHAALPAAIEVRSLVPARMDEGFLARLRGEDVLFGPRDGWTWLPGEWGTPYNMTKTVDRTQGPAGLLEGEAFADASLSARCAFRAGCELGAVLLRAEPHAGGFTGVEALFEPAEGRVRLVLHEAGAGPRVLAEAGADLGFERWHDLRFEVAGSTVRLWLDGAAQPLLEASDPALPGRGRLGLRAWGDAFRLAGVTLSAGGSTRAVPPDERGTPEQRGLQSLCLALLNLNEFVYVD
jgi:mono/diheme cytochrome c family protein